MMYTYLLIFAFFLLLAGSSLRSWRKGEGGLKLAFLYLATAFAQFGFIYLTRDLTTF